MADFIQRKVFFELKNHLPKKEISIILGPRQAGKTTVIKKLQQELSQLGKPTVFLNLDVIEDRQFFESQHTLLYFIQKKVGERKAYIFIDEISRLENAGLFLKGLYDLQPRHKFIVTGSGSLELKAQIVEPLTGRKKVFYCLPLSFTEFTAYKRKLYYDSYEKLLEKTTTELAIQPLVRQRLTNEYLNFGGYPRVTTSQTEEEKRDVLQEIYTSYLEKDIKLLLNITKDHIFASLIRILATQTGNLINRAELASILGVTEKTIKQYLHLLEETYIINIVRPYFSNARKELTKSPKIYFLDLGFLYIAQGILPTIKRNPQGNVFENACFLRLKELKLIEKPKFWRTKSKAEVDFIITSTKTGKLVPIEVKSTAKRTLGKSLISFINKYKPDQGFIYFQSGTGKGGGKTYKSKSFQTNIHFIPYHLLPSSPPTSSPSS